MSSILNSLPVNSDMGSKLYSKLPNIYRAEDSRLHPTPYQLKMLIDVLGKGLDHMNDKIEGYEFMYDADRCPVEFLPHLAKTLGHIFPYALPEVDQRKFVKSLPNLYQMKGTPPSFEYLAREIFGRDVKVNSYKADSVDSTGKTPEEIVREWKKIFVEIEAEEGIIDVGIKEQFYRMFAESVRPVNTILVVDFALYFAELYDFRNNVSEFIDVDNLIHEPVYDSMHPLPPPEDTSIIGDMSEEMYNALSAIVEWMDADTYSFNELLDEVYQYRVIELQDADVLSCISDEDYVSMKEFVSVLEELLISEDDSLVTSINDLEDELNMDIPDSDILETSKFYTHSDTIESEDSSEFMLTPIYDLREDVVSDGGYTDVYMIPRDNFNFITNLSLLNKPLGDGSTLANSVVHIVGNGTSYTLNY